MSNTFWGVVCLTGAIVILLILWWWSRDQKDFVTPRDDFPDTVPQVWKD